MTALATRTDRDDRPTEDRTVVLSGVGWADYQRLLEIRGEHSVPRFAYNNGGLEIMSPSRSHEAIKALIGRLVETFCIERDIEFSTYGSWTLENKELAKGVEPDECYVIGPQSGAPLKPHLAIEVVWTSGGIDKLEIYQALGVQEVWFWRKGALTAHVLKQNGYEQTQASEALPAISLNDVLRFIVQPTTSAAIRAYRDFLRGGARTT
jgi:Uma2 family endonuclease